MIKTNYHTHFSICDGKGDAREYVEAAIRKGFSALGFSSHAPLSWARDWTINREDLETYYATVDELIRGYSGELQIWKGLEIDYLEQDPPGANGPDGYLNAGLDYRIGSVHAVFDHDDKQYYCVDGPLEEFRKALRARGDLRRLVESYYRLVRQMLAEHSFDILGHIDLVKKRCWQELDQREPWYQRCVMETLEAVRASGVILEVNTGGMARGALPEIYPSPWILKECLAAEIPIVLNADAHDPDQIDFYYPEAEKIIRESGYQEIRILTEEGWSLSPI